MKKINYQKLVISGMSLPIAMMFMLGGSGILYAFYKQLYTRNWNVNYKIAQYKAKLNAHSGITYAMANYLYRRDFISVSDSINKKVDIDFIYPTYLSVGESIASRPVKSPVIAATSEWFNFHKGLKHLRHLLNFSPGKWALFIGNMVTSLLVNKKLIN